MVILSQSEILSWNADIFTGYIFYAIIGTYGMSIGLSDTSGEGIYTRMLYV